MRSRAVSASIRPQVPTSAGASDQPSSVPAGMVMLIRAGSGVLRPVWSNGDPGGGPSNPAGGPRPPLPLLFLVLAVAAVIVIVFVVRCVVGGVRRAGSSRGASGATAGSRRSRPVASGPGSSQGSPSALGSGSGSGRGRGGPRGCAGGSGPAESPRGSGPGCRAGPRCGAGPPRRRSTPSPPAPRPGPAPARTGTPPPSPPGAARPAGPASPRPSAAARPRGRGGPRAGRPGAEGRHPERRRGVGEDLVGLGASLSGRCRARCHGPRPVPVDDVVRRSSQGGRGGSRCSPPCRAGAAAP